MKSIFIFFKYLIIEFIKMKLNKKLIMSNFLTYIEIINNEIGSIINRLIDCGIKYS